MRDYGRQERCTIDKGNRVEDSKFALAELN